jgi:hypothetical protein
MGYDVLAMDVDEKRVQATAPTITRAAQADGTDEAVLRELGVDKFDVAIVAMGSDIKNSALSTISYKVKPWRGPSHCCYRDRVRASSCGAGVYSTQNSQRCLQSGVVAPW